MLRAMAKHLDSADIECLRALALIRITFEQISALLALKRHSPFADADFLSGVESIPALQWFGCLSLDLNL